MDRSAKIVNPPLPHASYLFNLKSHLFFTPTLSSITMSHNWGFICFLLSIPTVIVALYLIWRYFNKKQQEESCEEDQIQEQHDKDRDPNDQFEKYFEPQQPRRSKKTEDNQKTEKKPIIKNKDVADKVNDNFLKEFDERDQKRKQLQEQNEAELKKLLKWKSPFEFYHSPSKAKQNISAEKKINLPTLKPRIKSNQQNNLESLQSNTENVLQRSKNSSEIKEWLRVDNISQSPPKCSPRQKARRRHSENIGVATNNNNNVTKVINFVAITSKESAPEYKPRNKIRPTPPVRRVDIPRQVVTMSEIYIVPWN